MYIGGRSLRVAAIGGFSKIGLLDLESHKMFEISKVTTRNRGKFEIIAEILRELRMPTGRTNLMCHCNMNSAQSGDYLAFMKSADLIRVHNQAGKVMIERTEVGKEFLRLFNSMLLLLDSSISMACLP